MLKKTVSLTLFFSLFFMVLTALVVYVEPSARVADWADWTFLGLPRSSWDGAHLGMGLLFLASGVTHLVLNWDALLDHLRKKNGEMVIFTPPFFMGLAVCLLVFVASLAHMPPIRQMVALSGYFKERAAEIYGEAPYAKAERSTLESFARRMGIDREKALALLRMRNIKAESATQTLAEIARQNGVAPGGVFEALKMVMEPSAGPVAGLPKDPPPGLGRRKLSDICEEYGLDVKAVLARLDAGGLRAHPAWTLAEVAKTNNVSTYAVYEALREAKPMGPVQVEVSSTQPSVTAKTQPEAPTPVAAPRPEPETPKPAQPQAATTPTPQPQAAQPAPHGNQPYQPSLPHELPAQGQAQATPPVQPGYQPTPTQPAQGQGYPTGTPQSGYQPAPVQPGVAQPLQHQPLVPAPTQPVQVQPVQPTQQPAQAGQVQPLQPGTGPSLAQPGLQAGLQPTPTLPAAPPPGLEKMMLQTYCREYNIPLSTAVGRLARHKITAFGDMTFEELSLENNKTPSEILRLVTTGQ